MRKVPGFYGALLALAILAVVGWFIHFLLDRFRRDEDPDEGD